MIPPTRSLTKRDCFALHAKYGLPPHRMTSKAINDIKKFSVTDRAKWLEIKKNDTNYANKRKAGVEGYKSYEKEAEAAQ